MSLPSLRRARVNQLALRGAIGRQRLLRPAECFMLLAVARIDKSLEMWKAAEECLGKRNNSVVGEYFLSA
jgi:hypothetical protein